MKRVIFTADDFGLAEPVNEAVERAHRDGVLTAASLMVAEPAADDAIARARTMPALGVGLHVVVVNGRPVSPPETIPDLVGRDGRFPGDLAAAGVRFFFRPGIRRQLEREIRAQFARFAASGLALDHVNAQNHLHLHPTVLGIVLRVARAYGRPPVRVPYEPFGPSLRASGGGQRALRAANAYALAPWLALMRGRLRRNGIASPDRVFGVGDAGRMTRDRVVALLHDLPDGDTEFFFHAATRRWPGIDPALAAFALEDELATLVDPEVRRAVASAGARAVPYAALRDA